MSSLSSDYCRVRRPCALVFCVKRAATKKKRRGKEERGHGHAVELSLQDASRLPLSNSLGGGGGGGGGGWGGKGGGEKKKREPGRHCRESSSSCE